MSSYTPQGPSPGRPWVGNRIGGGFGSTPEPPQVADPISPPSDSPTSPATSGPSASSILPLLLAFAAAWLLVVLSHRTLLHLPYFWDEAGYYVPAALDFLHTGTLIPAFTNAHPPLPSVVLGSAWHLLGFHIVVTRLVACTFAAAAIASCFALGRRLLGNAAAAVLACLTAVYPIWFAQSSLAHADIFAAAFTLAAFALYFTSQELIGRSGRNFSSRRRLFLCSALFCLSVLSKETAVIQPVALAGLEGLRWLRIRRTGKHVPPGIPGAAAARAHLRWAACLLVPIPVLAGWYAYHFARTGFIFGNPTYLRYNATANLTASHVFYALRIRLLHLAWQRNLWVPVLLGLACGTAHRRSPSRGPQQILGLPRAVTATAAVLLVVNLFAFAVLGGALLTRYLLPMYPLLLLILLAQWRACTRLWPVPAAITAAAFAVAIWRNPNTFFAPEDNLTYRDMIVVQQRAIRFLNQRFPEATVLTAWPASSELFKPELGYTPRAFHVRQIEDFTPTELRRAAAEPGSFDTALVFTTHYVAPGFRRSLLEHPRSWRSRRYAADLDLMPAQIARILGGEVVWEEDVRGEWAAVLRFPRRYQPSAIPSSTRIPAPPSAASKPPVSGRAKTHASEPRP